MINSASNWNPAAGFYNPNNYFLHPECDKRIYSTSFIHNNMKGSPRVCPDLSMDFVRLIFFKVFWMLINVQKKFLENSDFKVACKTVF